jgi:hypothetical protein
MKTFSLKTVLRIALLGFTLVASNAFALSTSRAVTNWGEEGFYDCHDGFVWVWNDERNEWDYVFCWDCECEWFHEYYWYEETVQVTGTSSDSYYYMRVEFSDSHVELYPCAGNGGTISQVIYYTSDDPYPTSASVIETMFEGSGNIVTQTRPSGSSLLSLSYTTSWGNRSEIESGLSSILGRPLDGYDKKRLDAGCIGVAFIIQRPRMKNSANRIILGEQRGGNGFPESLNTSLVHIKGFRNYASATAWSCSGRSEYYVKIGKWKNNTNPSNVSGGLTDEIPADSVVPLDDGRFNYITRVSSNPVRWVSINHGVDGTPQTGGASDQLPLNGEGEDGVIWIKVCIDDAS